MWDSRDDRLLLKERITPFLSGRNHPLLRFLPRNVVGHEERRYPGYQGRRRRYLFLPPIPIVSLDLHHGTDGRRQCAQICRQRHPRVSVPRRHIPDDIHDAALRFLRVVELREGVHQTHPEVQKGRRGATRDSVVPIRCTRRNRLVQHQDTGDGVARAEERLDEEDLARARVREDHADAQGHQRPDDAVRVGPCR